MGFNFLVEKVYKKKIIIFSLSFFIVAFGQPAWIKSCSFIAAFFGFALFWSLLRSVSSLKKKFLISSIWFGLVQSIQISWMTSIKYQGPYIYLVYLFLIVALGMQFGLLSVLISKVKKISTWEGLAFAGIWTIMEWLRLFFISGFSWNPVGLTLTTSYVSAQMASVFGIYGLSFWVIFTNILAYKAWFIDRVRRNQILWGVFVLFPLFFGVMHIAFFEKMQNKKQIFSALLVQTSLLPEEKNPMAFFPNISVPPIYQWKRIIFFLKKEIKHPVDLIVLPEAALPYGAHNFSYSYDEVKKLWIREFGEKNVRFLPKVTSSYIRNKEGQKKVSNTFLAQALANYYKAQVIVGLSDKEKKKNYNAAFCFTRNKKPQRYIKRILVPIGEYIPFKWSTSIAEKFGIFDSFTPGKKAKIFHGKIPFGVSICYEETYGYIIREFRRKGAQMLVNITNDVWFPNSKLPQQHYDHGKIRAIENGVAVLRSCNTGITGAIDPFGREIKNLVSPNIPNEKLSGALFLSFPLFHYPTMYTIWGDGFIIGFSLLFIIIFLGKKLSTCSK